MASRGVATEPGHDPAVRCCRHGEQGACSRNSLRHRRQSAQCGQASPSVYAASAAPGLPASDRSGRYRHPAPTGRERQRIQRTDRACEWRGERRSDDMAQDSYDGIARMPRGSSQGSRVDSEHWLGDALPDCAPYKPYCSRETPRDSWHIATACSMSSTSRARNAFAWDDSRTSAGASGQQAHSGLCAMPLYSSGGTYPLSAKCQANRRWNRYTEGASRTSLRGVAQRARWHSRRCIFMPIIAWATGRD